MKITTQIAFWSVVPVLAFLGDRCPPGKARLAFERKTVASLPQGTEARSAQFSPNGLHIAHVVHLGDKAAVALDGAICPLFESVKLGSLLFRPDGAELAYLAKAGGTWHVVRGTEPGPGFDEIPEISYAPAGSALAYLGRRGEAWFAVIDGVERGPYQKAYFLTMAPAGNRVAYAATEADGVHLHVDSDVGPPYRMVSPPVFNADGSRIGYPARKGDTWTLVVDGREGGLYAIVNGPVFAPSGAVYATVQRDGNSFVIRDGQVVSDSFRSIVTDVSLNPDGTRMGFGIAESNQARMVVDGVKGNLYGMVLPILFSGDGRHYAYAANKQGAFVLVRDGVESKLYGTTNPRSMAFTPDGSRLVYVAVFGDKEAVISNGKQLGNYNSVPVLRLAPDQKRIVYVANTGAGPEMFVESGHSDGVSEAWLPKSFRFEGSDHIHILAAPTGRIDLLTFKY